MRGMLRAMTTHADPPQGFRYYPDLLTASEEKDLLVGIAALCFADIRMRGVAAKRRTVHFGWLYGYESRRLTPGPPIPDWLMPLRERAAQLMHGPAEELQEALVTEYRTGAGIGWHRDAPMFGPRVVGVSLAGPCRMLFRRRKGTGFERFTQLVESRSAYVLSGPSRFLWQHSIPATAALRYSITFRALNAGWSTDRQETR